MCVCMHVRAVCVPACLCQAFVCAGDWVLVGWSVLVGACAHQMWHCWMRAV